MQMADVVAYQGVCMKVLWSAVARGQKGHDTAFSDRDNVLAADDYSGRVSFREV